MATHRTSRVILGFAAAAVVAQLAPPAWARKARPTPCPGGRFVVHDTPLLGGAAGPQPDIVVFDAAHLAVASGCPATTLKRSASRRGTTLKAAFPRCAGVTGTVKLTAKVEPTCHTMTGTLAARKSRPRFRRQFSAGLEQCDTGGDCGANTSTVRYCAYVPGLSQAATMPPEVVNPPPTTSTTLPPLPPSTAVPPATTQAQTDIFTAIRQVVAGNYIYPNFRGVDWTGIGATYAALIQAGLTDDDFHAAMQRMILELGDDHSHYMTPQEVADEAAEQARGMDFVGIGVLAQPLRGTGTVTIIVTYPGSPAREAGLRPHDVLRTVDGQPAFDETTGQSTLRGPAGTQLALAFQRPGESPRTITLTRREVTGFTPIDACVVPTTRIGYVLVPTLLDPMIDDEVRAALLAMTAAGPLDGLVIDDRLNGGGSSLVVRPMLGFFTSGVQGQIVTSTGATDIDAEADDVGGTQTVPLVLLADHDTVSFAEIFTGVLQRSGRARIVGGQTAGNVEILFGTTFQDGSRLWLASATFAPNGLAPGVWEGVGITPDVAVPTRWDLFTEATDPGLSAAIDAVRSAAPATAGPPPAATERERRRPALPEMRSSTAAGLRVRAE